MATARLVTSPDKQVSAHDQPDESHALAVQHTLLEWYEIQGRDLPWRATRDPYEILVSEIMLQQTQVDRVLPKYAEFLERFPTLVVLAEAPLSEVLRVWSPLGYNRRARYLHLAARAAQERFSGVLPSSLIELRTLPGLGRYTAAAVACFAFEQSVPLVDTNVRRVLSRIFLGILEGTTDSEAWKLAEKVLPVDRAYPWNQALMDLGATTCIAETPRCENCPLIDQCQWRAVAAEIPRRVRERAANYKAKSDTGAARRRWRGRIMNALREVDHNDHVDWILLKASLRSYGDPGDVDLDDLLESLCRDGLVECHSEQGSPQARLAQ